MRKHISECIKVVEQVNCILLVANGDDYEESKEFQQSPTNYSSSFTNNQIIESHRIEKAYLADEPEVLIKDQSIAKKPINNGNLQSVSNLNDLSSA